MTPSPDLIDRLEKAREGSRELDLRLEYDLNPNSFSSGRHYYGADGREGMQNFKWSEAKKRDQIIRDWLSEVGRTSKCGVGFYTTSLNAALALVERKGLDAREVLYDAMEDMGMRGWNPDAPTATQFALRVCLALLHALRTLEPQHEE